MGNCCTGDKQKTIINTDVRNPDWADACKTNNIAGIKMMHATDPDLINEPVNKKGECAIHLAIKNKNHDLLDYLLKNGVNINAQGGKAHNTALHCAVLIPDMVAVRYLFSFGIDDSITNINGKTALGLCPKKMTREFTKAKQFRNKHREEYDSRHNRNKTSNDVHIAGMNLSITPADKIKKYVKDTDDANNQFKLKKKEIEERDMSLTAFGDDVGCEVDEIAMTLQKVPNRGKLWEKWAKKHTLTKQTEIYKILFGLTVLTLKKKNPRAKKPNSQQIKILTSKLCTKDPKNQLLPRKKGRAVLSKEDFVKNCHTYLYTLHDRLCEEEADSD